MKKKKKIVLQLNVKPLWMIGTGHHGHISGSGEHDSRTKRLRTRGANNRKAISDGW